MQMIRDGIWLCSDCAVVACNGPNGVELQDDKATILGLQTLGPHLVPDFDLNTHEGERNFSSVECAACHTILKGARYRFAILGNDSESEQNPGPAVGITHDIAE